MSDNHTLTTEPRFEIPAVMDVTALGEGLRLVSNRQVDFTREFCERGLNDWHDFPGERQLRNDRVSEYIGAMIRGTFMWEQVNIIYCTCLGKEYRMNGQHTMWARLEAPDSISTRPVRLLHYNADSMEDMRTLYASIDRSMPRSKGQVVWSYLGGDDQFADYRKGVVSMVAAGLAFWHWGHDGGSSSRKHDGDEIAYLMKTESARAVAQVAGFMSQKGFVITRKHFLSRQACVAAMFETFTKAHDDSVVFWTGVRDGANLGAEDARLKLRNALQASSVYTTDSSPKNRVMSSEQMYRLCVFAWNAWRKGEPVKQLKTSSSDTRPKAK